MDLGEARELSRAAFAKTVDESFFRLDLCLNALEEGSGAFLGFNLYYRLHVINGIFCFADCLLHIVYSGVSHTGSDPPSQPADEQQFLC